MGRSTEAQRGWVTPAQATQPEAVDFRHGAVWLLPLAGNVALRFVPPGQPVGQASWPNGRVCGLTPLGSFGDSWGPQSLG